ncbi:M15 family metallopeptidase [Microbacterium enclense]|uniref:M15 family metallopeptidase n=1 Tax=Microbacterium enclense TaxID=993073 RepID=UPI003F7FA494
MDVASNAAGAVKKVAPIDESKASGKLASAAIDVGTEAALGAARGGVAGAAAGAAKGAVNNKHSRRTLLRIFVWSLVVQVAAIVMVVVSVLGVISAISGGQAQQTNSAELADNVSQLDADAASDAVNGSIVPQTIYVGFAKKTGTAPDITALAAAMTRAGLDSTNDNPAAGAVSDGKGNWTIGTDDQNGALATRTEDAYTTALTDYGLDQITAKAVFALARQYALGTSNTCSAGSAAAAGTSAAAGASDAGTYNASQVQNMQTIIGIAKTMFGDQAQAAAVVGLATAAVESGFQNYANSTIDYSLTLAHDAVGSDHDSLGIMQQRASGSWGAVGDSTWASDPNTVVTRLMTPAFAASRFFGALQGVPGWQDMPPGQAAQTVQVSAKPDAYAGKVSTAQALWAAYGATTAAIPVPDGASPSSPASTSATASASAAICSGISSAPMTEGLSGPVTPGPWGGYQNGQIPLSALVQISWDPNHGDAGKGTYLRPDAAAALAALNEAFAAHFGYALPINDAYRDFSEQLGAYAEYGYPRAALPGTSNHGWAMAVDIGTQSHATISFGSDEYEWLIANGEAYGWFHYGSVGNGEAWHFQYYGVGGGPTR